MPAEIWKDPEVARAFLHERSLLIPDRPRQLDVLLRVTRSLCPQAHAVLDLGTGDGLLLATLLDAYPQAKGIGVDFSPLMLEQARQRLAPFGDRATTFEADLGVPTWKASLAEPFDIIVSGFAIHHLEHERKRQLYGEVYELLSRGGVFVNTEHVASSTTQIEALFDDAMTQHLYQRRREKGEAVTLEEVRRAFFERPDRAANILAPVEDQCRWLRDIGFQDVDCFWKYFELAIFGGRKGDA